MESSLADVSPSEAPPTVWQKSLLNNLSHKRSVLALCQYYQRHSAIDEVAFMALMDELIAAYQEEVADLSHLLRLYDVPPSEAEMQRHLVRDGRARRTTQTRLEMLLGLVKANAHWYRRELGRQPPPDIAALWTSLLAAEQSRVEHISILMDPESALT
ncbi:MAG: hypothetical protein HZY76_18915 [Anaerolineae bacterium]|nr:MAG: hypothetical protein HZY76_18915 [Anaerolineae bacterium]